MPKVLALYYVTYIVFMYNKQQLHNKMYNLLFIGKSKEKKPYKLASFHFFPK
jgi:hypothetical protein